MNGWNNKVGKIMMLLGSACNLHCNYCIQGEVKTCRSNYDLSSSALNFLNKLDTYNGKKIIFAFYGGEPLIYWKSIVSVVERYGDKFDYRIITNGKLIDKKIVDFSNKYKIRLHVSWDGRNSMITRRYDVMKDKFDYLMDVEKLGVHTVLTKYSPLRQSMEDINEINSVYRAKHGSNIKYTAYFARPVVNLDSDIFDLDLQKLALDIEYFCNKYINKLPSDTIEFDYVNKYYWTYKEFIERYTGKFDVTLRRCNRETMTINMDLDGNLYSCPNASSSISSILEDYDIYSYKMMESDCYPAHFEKCKSCFALPVCMYGCRLLRDNKESDEKYCKASKVFAGTFVRFFERMLVNGKLSF